LAYIERFHGSEDMKVDSKYRLSVPADFRRVLESQDPDWTPGKAPRMMLLTGPRLDGFVEGYSIDSIAEIQDALSNSPKADPKFKALRNHYIHSAVSVTVDETGRIVVPQKVRDKLGLGKDEYVTFLGDLKTFQLWKRDEYQARFAEEADELGEDFDPDAAMDELLFANASPKEVE
jgi:MraZ protein